MEAASIRQLRNNGGALIARVAGGEPLVITNNGKPVAELHPLGRQPLSAAVITQRFRNLPPVDPERLRTDIDELVGQRL